MSVYESKDNSDSIIIACDCGWSEHEAQLDFWPDNPYPDLFILSFRLTIYDNLFVRIKTAIKYIFGKYSHNYDDLIINVKSAERIRDFISERLNKDKSVTP